jgi:LEA14-like dessication related protein
MKDPLVKIGIFGALAFAAYKLFPKAKELVKAATTGGRLNVNLSGIQFKKPFGVKFRVVNPTDGELSVKAIAGDVLAKGNAVATFVVTDEIKITPNSQQIVNVPLKINVLSFLPIVTDIINLGNDKNAIFNYLKSIDLKVTGTVNAAGIPIKIDQKIY